MGSALSAPVGRARRRTSAGVGGLGLAGFPFGAADPHGMVGESPAAWALRDDAPGGGEYQRLGDEAARHSGVTAEAAPGLMAAHGGSFGRSS
jgi:hypothetical protein